MEPGKELDSLIAEKVFGWKRYKYTPEQLDKIGNSDYTKSELLECEWFFEGDSYKNPPRYSTEIDAAWLIVEKLCSDYYFSISDGELGELQWKADFDNGEGRSAHGKTAPHAICLAALRVING